MKLSYSYANQDEIPEKYRDLYEEKDGLFVLTGIEGIKTQTDVQKLQTALAKEREDHKATKTKLSEFVNAFGDQNILDIKAKIDKVSELEALASNQNGDAIEKAIAARTEALTKQLDRAKQDNLAKVAELQDKILAYEKLEAKRKLHDAVKNEVTKSKGFVTTALEDVLLAAENAFVANGNEFLTQDGKTLDDWFSEQKNRKPHWWGVTEGGGAKGSSGSNHEENPWDPKHLNLTKQGQIYNQDPAKARKMAAVYGVQI